MENLTKLPVEVELENQKILKSRMELQSLIQNVAYELNSRQQFYDALHIISKEMNNLRKLIDHFSQLAKEWRYDGNYEKLIKPLVDQHSKVLQALQVSMRKASMTGEERLAKAEKQALVSTDDNFGKNNSVKQRKIDKSQIANRASDITKNLVSIARMMDAQVKRGEESNAVLQESSEVIKETHDEYKGLTGIISLSRKLINKYNRRELTDTLLIFFGLVFFFATVVYIISKRLPGF